MVKEQNKKGVTKSLNALDLRLTQTVFDLVNYNSVTKMIPYWFGLLPYELYVLPGMFVALIVTVYHKSYQPAQIHLLPLWFAYSLVTSIKQAVKRERPGCAVKAMGTMLAKNHCDDATRFQSFPSGHMLIASALAMSGTMFLDDQGTPDKNKTWLGIPFYDPQVQLAAKIVAYVVVFMVGLHRVGFGYHYVGDVVVGFLLGIVVGYVSYNIFRRAKEDTDPEDPSGKPSTLLERVSQGTIVLLSLWGIGDFFAHKFSRLTEVKH
jgi:membrane-associated phospholipid phosphatase